MKLFILIFTIIYCGFYSNSDAQTLEYPKARITDQSDVYFNETIKDEYRWMENTNSAECENWVDAQNQITNKILRKAASKYNSFNAVNKYAYVKYDNPQKHGKYYFTYAFYDDNSVPGLFIQHTLKSQPTILVEPKFISNKDIIRLKNYEVSSDSKHLAIQYSRNGSDWGEIKIINIATGNYKKDHLTHVKFSNIAWRGNGFYYSTYPDNGNGITQGQKVYYHELGTDQSEDKLVFRRSNNPEAYFRIQTTSDERFMILKEIDEVHQVINLFYIDFNAATPALRPLLRKLSYNDNLSIIDNHGDELIASSAKDGNNSMVIKINPIKPRDWHVLIPEFKSTLLLDVKVLDNKLLTLYQNNRKQQINIFDLEGKLLESFQLPFGFSVSGFNGEKTDKEILFAYEGYTQPKVVYILNTETLKMEPLRSTVVNFDHTKFETKEIEYASFDGTKVSMFMVYKKGINLEGNNPTLLKAYGGFGSINLPRFTPGIVHFLNRGGLFVFANIRGGGDNGISWASQGRGKHKQNSFNDFIAAAEFLIKTGYTSADKLAITGASNGGLVVGVAMTQRPELFKVAVPVVAPFDMMRFEQFTVGNLHTDEYGSVSDSLGYNSIKAYSPLHHIKNDVNYPATLIMTSENDDRVPPLHSYKFAAKLQSRTAQKNPILLKVEKNAGHYGANKNLKAELREAAEMYDFILSHLL